MPRTIDKLTFEIGVRVSQSIDKQIEAALPKWYVLCVKRGGVAKWLANKVLRVIILEIKTK